jgi:hypothetical protein
MGLTIHYSGKIDRIEAIPLFVDELTDIANAMQSLKKHRSKPSLKRLKRFLKSGHAISNDRSVEGERH